MLWRRKNVRLDARLNTVIETSERVRQSAEPKPRRVVVDTTYVQPAGYVQPSDETEADRHPPDAEGYDHPDADLDTALRRQADDPHATEAEPHAETADHVAMAELGQTDGTAAADGEPIDEAQLELEALFEAAEQCEQALLREAEAREREAAALAEVETQRQLATQLEARAQREQDARRAAEAKHEAAAALAEEVLRELGVRRLAETRHREVATRMEAEAEREQSARRAAEASCEDAVRRLDEMHLELAGLREGKGVPALACIAEVGAPDHEAMARLEAETQREQSARREAEAQHQDAVRQLSEAQRELATLRASHGAPGEPHSGIDDPEYPHNIARLEAQALREQASRRDAEALRDEADRNAAEAQRELALLRTATEQREQAARHDAVIRQRALAARQEADTLRDMAAGVEIETQRTNAARITAEAQRDMAAAREAGEQREQVIRREAQIALQEIAERLDVELQRVLTLRGEAEKQREATLHQAAKKKKDAAAVRATAEQREQALLREAQAAHQELAAQLAAEVQRGQSLRLVAEKQRDDALRQSAQLQTELAAARKAADQQLRAAGQAAAAQLCTVSDRLEAEIERERAGRQDTEARRCETERVMAETLSQMAVMRTTAAQREATARCVGETERDQAVNAAAEAHRELTALRAAAEQRELGLRREAETTLQQASTRLRSEIAREQAARLASEVQRDDAIRRAAEARGELASLREAAKHSTQTVRGEAEARIQAAARVAADAKSELTALKETIVQRVHAAHLDVEATHRENLARLQAELHREHAAHRETQVLREDAIAAASEAQRELAALKDMARQREAAEQLQGNLQLAPTASKGAASQHQDAACAPLVANCQQAAPQETVEQHETALAPHDDMQDWLSALPEAVDLSEPGADTGSDVEPETEQPAAHENLDPSPPADKIATLALATVPNGQSVDNAAEPTTAAVAVLVAAQSPYDQSPYDQSPSLQSRPLQSTPDQQPLESHRALTIREPANDPRPAASVAPKASEPTTKPAAPALSARAQSIINSTQEKSRRPETDATAAGLIYDGRAKRAVSQMPALLSGNGMQQALACVIRDKSSSGALIEVARSSFGEGHARLAIGDKLTLTFNSSQERTSVACVVARIEDNRYGIQFCGQFRTQSTRPKQPMMGGDKSGAKPAGRLGILGTFRKG